MAAWGVLLCVLMQSATAIELRRERLVIDFPAPPAIGEAVSRSPVGPVNRFAAVAVTAECDYALFEFRFPRELAEVVGEAVILPQAVRESVARHHAQVHSLERGVRGGQPLVDVEFSTEGAKSQGRARYLQVGATVFEAATLCAPGALPDPQFLRTMRVL